MARFSFEASTIEGKKLHFPQSFPRLSQKHHGAYSREANTRIMVLWLSVIIKFVRYVPGDISTGSHTDQSV